MNPEFKWNRVARTKKTPRSWLSPKTNLRDIRHCSITSWRNQAKRSLLKKHFPMMRLLWPTSFVANATKISPCPCNEEFRSCRRRDASCGNLGLLKIQESKFWTGHSWSQSSSLAYAVKKRRKFNFDGQVWIRDKNRTNDTVLELDLVLMSERWGRRLYYDPFAKEMQGEEDVMLNPPLLFLMISKHKKVV